MQLSEFNVYYKADLTKNYMIIEASETEINYKVKMINENHIPGLLQVKSIYINDGQQFMYDISSMQSVKILFEKRKLKAEDILNIVRGICETAENLEKYFLQIDNVILCSDMIFMNAETGDTMFTYNPFYKENIIVKLQELAVYFIGNIDYEDSNSISKAYMFNEIVSKDTFVIGDLVRIIESGYSGYVKPVQEIKEIEPAESQPLPEDKKPIWDKLIEAIKEKLGMIKKKEVMPVVCEEKTVYSTDTSPQEFGDTVLLSVIEKKGLTLKPERKKYEDIYMNESSMVIGKLEDRVDVVINDPSVSRIHAKCENEGNRYFVEDLNTTNGTYLNECKMIPYKIEEIKDGDRLMFGQVVYCVMIR